MKQDLELEDPHLEDPPHLEDLEKALHHRTEVHHHQEEKAREDQEEVHHQEENQEVHHQEEKVVHHHHHLNKEAHPFHAYHVYGEGFLFQMLRDLLP